MLEWLHGHRTVSLKKENYKVQNIPLVGFLQHATTVVKLVTHVYKSSKTQGNGISSLETILPWTTAIATDASGSGGSLHVGDALKNISFSVCLAS